MEEILTKEDVLIGIFGVGVTVIVLGLVWILHRATKRIGRGK